MIGSSMKGFTLLIAVVLAAIAVSITLALTNFGYKSLVLSGSSKDSQYAFYAADAALECALYHDSGNAPSDNIFRYSTSPGTASFTCPPVTTTISAAGTYGSGETKYSTEWFTIHSTRCARFTVYKTANSARVYAEGTNVACSDVANPRAITRAIRAIY